MPFNMWNPSYLNAQNTFNHIPLMNEGPSQGFSWVQPTFIIPFSNQWYLTVWYFLFLYSLRITNYLNYSERYRSVDKIKENILNSLRIWSFLEVKTAIFLPDNYFFYCLLFHTFFEKIVQVIPSQYRIFLSYPWSYTVFEDITCLSNLTFQSCYRFSVTISFLNYFSLSLNQIKRKIYSQAL